MEKVFYKNFFQNKTRDEIKLWIDLHKSQLIGSAIFTKGITWTANLVSWAEGLRCNYKGFIPSHTGSIIEKDGEVVIFDMKPPKADVQSLEKYLWTTKEEFILVLRDFDLDTKIFNTFLIEQIGRGYPYMSALRSVLNKRQTQWNCHCSEQHARALQLCGYIFDESFNLECTPDELLHYMLK